EKAPEQLQHRGEEIGATTLPLARHPVEIETIRVELLLARGNQGGGSLRSLDAIQRLIECGDGFFVEAILAAAHGEHEYRTLAPQIDQLGHPSRIAEPAGKDEICGAAQLHSTVTRTSPAPASTSVSHAAARRIDRLGTSVWRRPTQSRRPPCSTTR